MIVGWSRADFLPPRRSKPGREKDLLSPTPPTSHNSYLKKKKSKKEKDIGNYQKIPKQPIAHLFIDSFIFCTN